MTPFPTKEQWKLWLYNPNFAWWQQHPMAHAMGGLGLWIIGLTIFQMPNWRAVAFTFISQGIWEDIQRENWHDAAGNPTYPVYSMVLDTLTATIVAALAALMRGALW